MQWLKRCVFMLVWGVLPVALAQPAPKRIAITFDDLPVSNIGQNATPAIRQQAAEITAKTLACLKRYNIHAAGFVIEMNINTPGARDFYAGLLEDWLRDGHLLGEHSYSHLQFGDVSLSAYEDDFLRGDVVVPLLLDYYGIKARYYRYPYNDTGNTAAKKNGFLAFLAAHGYMVAPMTFDNDDWMYSSIYDDALARKDAALAKRVEQEYLAENQLKIASIEKLSEMDFHRQIPQIAELHVTQMNADLLDKLLKLFQSNGYEFITMQQALADPAYKTPDRFVGSDGISWLMRWQPALGIPIQYDDDPEPPQWVQDAYTALEKSGAAQ
jgi:peptidoglycan/xylan/chitin deacetylase (PgdA/CDA1 family)